ncbi:MAG: hypothetical protein Kow00129_15820 [Thermoleophilia bacterium]
MEELDGLLPGTGARLLAFVRQTSLAQLRPALIWGVILGLLGALYTAMYPSMSQTFDLETYLEDMPEGMKAFIPSASQGIDSVEAFLDLELFSLMLPLALPFFLIIFGARAVAGREEQGRMDLLLSNPLPRWMIVVGTALAMVVEVGLASALIVVLTYLPSPLVGAGLSFTALAEGLLALLPFFLVFGALSLLLSTVMRRSAFVIGVSGAVLVGSYVVNGLGNYSEDLEFLKPYSFFHYFETPMRSGVEWDVFLVLSLIAVGLVALGAVSFRGRQIYT